MATYTLDQYIGLLDTAIEKMEAELPKISEEMATNTMALIMNKVQQDGIGRTYSNNKLPLFYFHDRALNAGGRNALEKKKKAAKKDPDEYGMSYIEWRIANGLQVAHKDYTFTGRMWQNIQVIGTVRRGNNFITIMGGTDKETKDKLRWNAERDGEFFILAPEDEKIIQDLGNKRMDALVKSLNL
jgi:hypothetical protein